jgi:hypothetical protein
VDYQQARLQVAFGISGMRWIPVRARGYWLEDPLPSYLAGASPVPAQPEPGDQAVLAAGESFEKLI